MTCHGAPYPTGRPDVTGSPAGEVLVTTASPLGADLAGTALPAPGDVTPAPEPAAASPQNAGCSEIPWCGSYRRRESLSGLVTLALLAILGAWIVTRGMRRIGLSMSRSSTFGFMFAFVVLVLMLWGQSFK
jgi:hypothetical protein